jgi:deazaflavin-dependent oxidoreductase (nitroreductase family)
MTHRTATAPDAAVQRAPRWVSLLNPLSRRAIDAGLPMGFNAVLAVPGRTSGLPRRTPLAIIEVDGRRWVWSPWGEVGWVRNLRAAGQASIEARNQHEDVRATELDPAERLAFFRDTLRPLAHRLRFGRLFVRVVDGVDVDDPETATEGRVVFELHRLP